MKVLVGSTLCILFATCVSALCPTTGDWQDVSGKCMQCGSGGKVAFLDARNQCIRSGGNLASIVDDAQEKFAETCSGDLTATIYSGVWFGLKLRSDGNFSWADGTEFVNVTSVSNKIADVGAGCYYINSINTWAVDQNCTTTKNYVCSHPLDCGVPQDISNGDVSFTTTLEGSVAVYKCNYGYLSSINTTRQCQNSGTWSGSVPSCTAVMCHNLTDPENGDVKHSANNQGSRATYDCDAGYKLSDETLTTRMCLSSGSWSASAPTCEKKNNTLAIVLGATLGGLALIGGLIGAAVYLARRPPTPMGPQAPRGAPFRAPYPGRPGPPNRGTRRGDVRPYPSRRRGSPRGYPKRPY